MKGCDANTDEELRKIIAELRDAVAQTVFVTVSRQSTSRTILILMIVKRADCLQRKIVQSLKGRLVFLELD